MSPAEMGATKFGRVLMWFRRDLRVSDNTAFARACAWAEEVVPVFVFDTVILDALEERDDRRVSFIHTCLVELDKSLKSHGSMLIVLHGEPVAEILRLAAALQADAVFTNRDYEPNAKERDARVKRGLESEGKQFLPFKDQVVFEGREILTGAGEPYRVFTPYKRAWLSAIHGADASESPLREERVALKRCAPAKEIKKYCRPWALTAIGFTEQTPWLEAGEKAARLRFEKFLSRIDDYKERRDVPALDATSGLSVHLRFGTISIRRLVREAVARGSEGSHTWLSELIWREFYHMILDQFPHVVGHAFKREYDSLRWPGRPEHFDAWRTGKTGYPLVDAAMRYFNESGWMHNRLRMVVAMFLTKDLLIDWKQGEAYFARYLLDFDLAANNGGWQWSASTGVDAQPYFRVFNPILQSRRFDPDGTFIRAHCPELSGFSNARIHWPHDADLLEQEEAGCRLGDDYPHAIVDHRVQKEKAVALFRQ